MKFIPSQNVVSNTKDKATLKKRKLKIESLAVKYRNGELNPKELSGYLLDDICAWLVNHPRRKI